MAETPSGASTRKAGADEAVLRLRVNNKPKNDNEHDNQTALDHQRPYLRTLHR